MDPVGPWYAPYNRLAGVQPAPGSAELHHPLTATTTAGPPPTTTAQILPGGFLSPPPVAYESVFSPLFHHAGAKPAAHYVSQVTQQRALAQAAATKQGEGEFHPQAQTFFEQGAAGAWQQNSPFGILPHESVVSTTTTKTYENFNAHFSASQTINNHLNSQISKSTPSNRSQSPQVSTTAATKTNNASQGSSGTFFQQGQIENASSSNKNFPPSNSTNIQQSCIVSSPNTAVSKEYRVPQAPARSFLSSSNTNRSNIEKTFASPPTKQQQSPSVQIQTKAQTKIYSEIGTGPTQPHQERQRPPEEQQPQSQSSPISFSIMDAPGRLNYSGSNSSGKRSTQFQHNYRHYGPQGAPQGQQAGQQTQQAGQPAAEDYQRPKGGAEYSSSNGPECGVVVVPRRPSPLQAHSQASPLGHAQSPAYPMYNSPMNSISSPQQSSNNQVTPPSPLDVSVPRPNSQTGVAYPSVITRALNPEKNFPPERYDRTNHQNQNCWDERQNQQPQPPQQQQQQQQRKFQNSQQTSNQTSNYTSNSAIEQTQQQQRVVIGTVADRQQATQAAYFETNSSGHQVTLQDLSSCRGDPMSIVKNLQQQQSCQQVQQAEIKQEPKPPIKRRKSSEKAAAGPELQNLTNRVPPPAHSSAANQPQQNGAYFDFDRWNLPPPAAKIFTTQALHQQHQGLMVPHPHGHHPPPHLPYFAPFHLAPPPAEYPATVELAPIPNYNDQGAQAAAPQTTAGPHYQQQQQPQQQAEEHPKVVVPNIEEELNFLSQDTTRPSLNHHHLHHHPHPKPVINPVIKPPDKSNPPNSGFMSSYLKFLQGERDTSPPPTMRGGNRKNTTSPWIPPRAPPKLEEKLPESNGIQPIMHIPPVIPPPVPQPIQRLSSQGDPQDDPRYFPLPKERKRRSFDSSDDDCSSDDDYFGERKSHSATTTQQSFITKTDTRDKEKKNKIKTPKSDRIPSEKKKKPPKPEKEKKQKQDKKEMKLENVPKRESTKRAAKNKNNLMELKDDEPEEPVEFQDSDSDPAWTPAANNGEEDIILPVKKTRRGRPVGSKTKKHKNLIAQAAQGAGLIESDGLILEQHPKKKSHKNKQNIPPTLEDNIAASLQNNVPSISEDGPFKSGEFVVIKSELKQEWPAIWRVDGKTLLQKYEPFEQNGVMLYRNISTYTSWSPESKKQYISVPVKYKSQGQLETIVEFLKSEMMIIDHEFQEECMKQFESYQDNFEVYIQTLISQALDSNFLMEIFQEKDEYFLSNVQTIDDVTDTKKKKFFSILHWPQSVQAAVCTWPCYNVIREVGASDTQNRSCAACSRQGVAVRVLMYGQPYNSTTLEGCQPDPNAISEKDFLMCRICAARVELLSKVTHQKYLMYIECAKRVSEKRTTDPTKDTTCILNELLADESWLNQLFVEVRTSWAEIDSIEHSLKSNNLVRLQ